MPERTAPSLLPGLALSVTVALAAAFAADRLGAPVMLFALLFGMALNILASDPRCEPGTAFASKTVLRAGIVLLGALITLGEIVALGLAVFLTIASGLVLTLAVGLLLGRLMGMTAERAILCAGAVAICGASAALAICAVLPPREDKERDTLAVVVGVTGLSTLAMVAYPAFTAALGVSDEVAGLFFGASIHDVAQVIGAGLTLSEEAGATAAVAKLTRVVLLAPVVLAIGLFFRRRGEAGGEKAPTPAPVPLFVLGFVLVVLINSVGLLPAPAAEVLTTASRWALIVAVAALGLRTSLAEMVRVGPALGLLLTLLTLFLAAYAWFGLNPLPPTGA
ncbi:MAG: putative sulfate exporter family transporter [Pseudomonadota bacterium]